MHRNLQYELYTLTDRIYSQILCLNGSNGTFIVTICPPILAAIEYSICIDDARSGGYKWKPDFWVPVLGPYYFDDPCNAKATGVSHNLLLLSSLNPSLTEYLTTWTRSKNLYVDANTYHTQMTEFWLDQCFGLEGKPCRDPGPYVIYFIWLHGH